MCASTCKLVSLNVRGIGNFKKRRTIFTWCRKQKADFIFLQETHSKMDSETCWRNEWGSDIIMAHGTSNSRGVAILVKKDVDCTIHSKVLDPSGQYVIIKAEFNDKMYVLINIYAPNKDSNIVSFFNNLLLILRNNNFDEEENIIMGGDFNCPLNPLMDKKGGQLSPRKSVVSTISNLLEEFDLVDIWRVKNPQKKSFTWSQNLPTIFCRLDYWLISNSLHDLVKAADIIPAIRTDHAAITLELVYKSDDIKGPGIWKMNCSLLDDEDYVNGITERLPIWLAEGRKDLSNCRSIWDWLKYNIRAHTIQYSKRKARERSEREKELQEQLANAKCAFETDPSILNANLLNCAKDMLELFYEEKVKGIIIRARARWHEHGEKSTKYFLNLEKRNHVKKHMRKLNINGSSTTDPSKILSEQQRFYQELYSSKNMNNENLHEIKSFLKDLNIPKLSEEQKMSCEGEITPEECALILDSFQNNKTPGNDGIPIEFYKKFWPLLCEPFILCANECFEKGEMSRSQKQAVITLIEKKGKDRSFLENWRPISLVNVDAKIMAKVIAARIQNVLPSIIHYNQTGFIKDRYIGETVRSIFDIMNFTVEENIPGLLIFIDFQKAFDSLERSFLQSCLESFNFGQSFIRWVSSFYKNIQSCVINNGIISDYFTVERGVRQGDPLSPYLFVVAVETLAIAIRQNPMIKGITIDKKETKLLQYADDTTVVLSDIDSAQTLFRLLDDFKRISGLAVNPSKTEAMWIGSLKENKSKPFGIKWPNEPIKALGVYYTYDQKLLHEKNFIERLDSVKKLVHIWSARGLSLYGKVTVIKSLIVPKFVYVASLLTIPKWAVQELNRLIFKFLWRGVDKVTRLSTINDYQKSGLKMIDLETMVKSLRLAWLKRIFSENDSTWKNYLRYQLKSFGGLFLFHCNYDVKDVLIKSPFYSELLQWWADFRDDFSTDKMRYNIIWNNKDIRINNKPIFYKTFFDNGFLLVSDLRFDLSIAESHSIIIRKIEKTNFLVWAGLRYAVPSHLKANPRTSDHTFLTMPPSVIIKNNDFDILKKKSKDYYSLLISKKAQLSKNTSALKRDFNLTEDQLEKAFLLPHIICSEFYVKAFQYKVLNSILYTNTKLYKIGYITDDKCSFCMYKPETLIHLLFDCVYAKLFWKDFELYYYSLSNELINLSLQDVLLGIIAVQCPLLNYFLLIAKLYIWDCRRSQTRPIIAGFKLRINIKFETEKYICTKNRTLSDFYKKWAILCTA